MNAFIDLFFAGENDSLLDEVESVSKRGRRGHDILDGLVGRDVLLMGERSDVHLTVKALDDTEHVGVIVEWNLAAFVDNKNPYRDICIFKDLDVGDGRLLLLVLLLVGRVESIQGRGHFEADVFVGQAVDQLLELHQVPLEFLLHQKTAVSVPAAGERLGGGVHDL